MRFFLIAALLCATCVQFTRVSSGAVAGDFRAFYCASKVAAQHADPYYAHPLYECESQPTQAPLYRAEKGVVLPAPLPGYALALFWPFTLMPYGTAVIAFSVLLFAALVFAIFALGTLTNIPNETTTLALALPIGLVSLPYGEALPVCIAALCAAGLYLERRNAIAAAIAAAVAMVEPHIGAPAAIAMFLFAPQTRVPLLFCAAILASASLTFLGVKTNVEYFASVLPAQAYSDIAHGTQFGLSPLLYQFGVGEHLAITLGEVQFFATLALGVWLGSVASRSVGRAALVLVPVAISLLGGPYVHLGQIAAAVPAAVLLAVRAPKSRTLFIYAAALLAVPWAKLAIFPMLVPCAGAVVGLLVLQLGADVRAALRAALAACVFGAVLILVTAAGANHKTVARAPEVEINQALAQSSWGIDVRQHSSDASIGALLAKTPTWAGLSLVLIASCGFVTSVFIPKVKRAEVPA